MSTQKQVAPTSPPSSVTTHAPSTTSVSATGGQAQAPPQHLITEQKTVTIAISGPAVFNGVHQEWRIDSPDVRAAIEAAYTGENTGKPICPEDPRMVFDMFRYLKPSDVRVVIIGQDPYPRRTDACGRAFWALSSTPHSARSIHANLLTFGHAAQDDIPPRATFAGWVRQGVLMINTSHTVVEETPDSHYAIWKGITERILSVLPRMSVALHLGNRAASVAVPCAYSVRHTHPVIPSDDIFSMMDCFGRVNDCLQSMRIAPIRWREMSGSL